MSDWIADTSLSREEKLAIFESLGPEKTVGPKCCRCGLVADELLTLRLGAITTLSSCRACASSLYSAIETLHNPV